MTIDEAISFLEDELTREVFYYGPGRKNAIRLGIEALKDFKRHRGRVKSGHYRILPGETE